MNTAVASAASSRHGRTRVLGGLHVLRVCPQISIRELILPLLTETGGRRTKINGTRSIQGTPLTFVGNSQRRRRRRAAGIM